MVAKGQHQTEEAKERIRLHSPKIWLNKKMSGSVHSKLHYELELKENPSRKLWGAQKAIT